MLWALVPAKELARSKQRLAEILEPREREELVLAMLRDVLTALSAVDEFDGVLLVSRSQRAQTLARDFVTDIFSESAGSDHSRAVTEANRYLIERHHARSSFAISGRPTNAASWSALPPLSFLMVLSAPCAKRNLTRLK